MPIEKSDYKEWLQHPITKELRKELQRHQADIATTLANGSAMDEMSLYAESVGRYREIADFLDMLKEWSK